VAACWRASCRRLKVRETISELSIHRASSSSSSSSFRSSWSCDVWFFVLSFPPLFRRDALVHRLGAGLWIYFDKWRLDIRSCAIRIALNYKSAVLISIAGPREGSLRYLMDLPCSIPRFGRINRAFPFTSVERIRGRRCLFLEAESNERTCFSLRKKDEVPLKGC